MGGGEGGEVYARGEQHSDRVSRYSWTRIGSFICYLCVHAAALSISAYKFAVAHDCVINAQEDVYRRKKKKKNDVSIFIGLPAEPESPYILAMKLRNDSNRARPRISNKAFENEHAWHVDHPV